MEKTFSVTIEIKLSGEHPDEVTAQQVVNDAMHQLFETGWDCLEDGTAIEDYGLAHAVEKK